MAAWDAYTVMHDENELSENLNILCNNRIEDQQEKRNDGFGIQMMPQKFNDEPKQVNISDRSIDDENESLSRDKNEDPNENQ